MIITKLILCPASTTYLLPTSRNTGRLICRSFNRQYSNRQHDNFTDIFYVAPENETWRNNQLTHSLHQKITFLVRFDCHMSPSCKTCRIVFVIRLFFRHIITNHKALYITFAPNKRCFLTNHLARGGTKLETYFEAFRLGPDISVVTGNRSLCNTSGCH